MPSGAAPPLSNPKRRFYRVVSTAIDTNGNGLFDWWELQNGISAFAVANTQGYESGDADPDGDGLSNAGEQ